MDPVQLMMAAHQADEALAAQTPDQSLQAAIAQSRPDLWAALSRNPAAYPDLLSWLASTGNVEVIANLRARGFLPADAVATRSLKAGELLPATAVGPAQEQNLRSILIEVAQGLPADVRAGDYVDLWALPAQSAATGQADAPQAELVAQNLIIVSIGQKDTGLVSGTTVRRVRAPVSSAGDGSGPVRP